MDRRAEPRFSVNQGVKVALADHPDSEWDGVIVDISGNGMKIVTARSIDTNARIRLSADGLIIVGHARHCASVGERFAVGLEVEGAHWQPESM